MNFLNKIFKGRKTPGDKKLFNPLTGSPPVFTPFSGDAYSNDIYRSAVDTIARNGAKLRATHIITDGQQRKVGDNTLNRILQIRPNLYMSSYDLWYKLITHYFLYNNAFAYLQKDIKGNLIGIYPLEPNNLEFLVDSKENIYCKFIFNSTSVTLSLSEVFIARRFFNSNELLGDNNLAIFNTLELAHAQNEGLRESIKSNAIIKGILKYNQVLSPERLKEEKDKFIKDYLSISNNGGIAVLDSKSDYMPLKSNESSIDEKQLQAIKEKIFNYLGVNENIVNSTYSENEWNAFYESVLEPLALQFGLELTEKLFTSREQQFGNTIMFESNRLQFASNKTKNDLIFNLLPMGILSINEAREILNMPGLADGNRYLQSLNYVNANKVDEYQLNKNQNHKTPKGVEEVEGMDRNKGSKITNQSNQ